MKVHRSELIPDLLVIEPRVFQDDRGFFMETYQAERYAQNGVPERFVQDNLSRSSRRVLRGLHYQLERPQAKLVSVVEGEVFDVAADIRRGSPTFGKWVGVVLSGENHRQLYIPEGFAHGFQVLSEYALFAYKCTDFYHPPGERGIRWDCPRLAIEWPLADPILSDKDAAYPTLADAAEEDLPVYEG